MKEADFLAMVVVYYDSLYFVSGGNNWSW